MCYRYALSVRPEIKTRFQITNLPLELQSKYNIALGSEIPVVVRGQDQNEMMMMKWGLIPHWAKEAKIGYNLGNAKAETLLAKPSFQTLVESKRCIVPASGFFEWKHIGKDKIPYYISPSDDIYFGFAGLYDIWKDQDDKDIYSVTIITTEPNPQIQTIHDRMPCILGQDHEKNWLYDDKQSVLQLLKPYQNTTMYQVSHEVNSVKSKGENLIQKISV